MEPEKPTLYFLSPRAVLRLSGPDRERYLNGQITQDVRLASDTRAVYSAVLNAKGQLDAVCHVRVHDDSYLIDAPLELRHDLLARLERYIIADDVELTDESDDWHVAHALGGELPPQPLQWATIRLDTSGIDLFSRQPIPTDGFEVHTADDFHSLCTAKGIPSWGTELTPGLLPPEAGLDRTAISYEKGCYLGQEVISRIKRAGKTNQHLVSLTVPPGTPAPCTLLHDDQQAGRLTSVAGNRALGFRKRKFAEVQEFSLQAPDRTTLPGTAVVDRD